MPPPLLLLASTIRELLFVNNTPAKAIPSDPQIAQPSSRQASPNRRNPNHHCKQIGEEEWVARRRREWWRCISDQLSRLFLYQSIRTWIHNSPLFICKICICYQTARRPPAYPSINVQAIVPYWQNETMEKSELRTLEFSISLNRKEIIGTIYISLKLSVHCYLHMRIKKCCMHSWLWRD